MKRISIITTIIITIVVIVTFSLTVSADFTSIGKIFGIRQKEYIDTNNGDVAILVNDSPIYRNEIEIDLSSLDECYNGTKLDEARKATIERKINETLLIVYAKTMGIKASSQEIDEMFKTNMDVLMNDEQAKTFMYDYIEGLGISEDQYYEMCRKSYEKSIIIGKLITETYDNGLNKGLYPKYDQRIEMINCVKSDLINQLRQNATIEYKLNQYKN